VFPAATEIFSAQQTALFCIAMELLFWCVAQA